MKIKTLQAEDNVDLTPMIDIVFLLLIYFMVTATLIRQEADLNLQLPAPSIAPPAGTPLPEEHIVDILADGAVLLNGAPMDDPNTRTMTRLANTLTRLRVSSERANLKTIVIIQAADDSSHQRSIDVLNACADAQIKFVSFSAEE